MAVMSRLLPMVAFSTFAIFVLALLATPVDALANEPHAHVARGHDSIAKRKRNAVKRAKRCRPQSASSAFASTSTSAAGGSYTHTSAAVVTSTSAAYSATHTTKAHTTKAPTSTAPATTKAATTTSVSSGGGSGGGGGLDSSKKLLLAWPNGPTDLSKYTGSRVGGLYTWSPFLPDNAASLGIPAFPQLWGANQVSDFNSQVNPSNGDCGLIFGFNEPNQVGQSDMSAQDGAALWISTIEPLRAKGCKLVSPATTSAPSGKQWIKDMLTACNGGCTFDYVGLHWYDVSISAFQAYVTDFHTTFGKPIIISEYACQNFNGGAQCSSSETWNLHQTMAQWFDQQDFVAMYAPFGFMHEMQGVNSDNQLMASDGGPTALGAWYLNH